MLLDRGVDSGARATGRPGVGRFASEQLFSEPTQPLNPICRTAPRASSLGALARQWHCPVILQPWSVGVEAGPSWHYTLKCFSSEPPFVRARRLWVASDIAGRRRAILGALRRSWRWCGELSCGPCSAAPVADSAEANEDLPGLQSRLLVFSSGGR